MIGLLAGLTSLLVVFPSAEGSLAGDATLNILQAGLVMAATGVATRRPGLFGISALLAALSLFSGWLPRDEEAGWAFLLGAVAGSLSYLLPVVLIISAALREQKPNIDMLCAAICAFLLIGLAFAEACNILEYLHPQSFLADGRPDLRLQWPDLLYVSFTTLTQAGAAGIAPANSHARSLCIIESLVGVFYMAVMIARLVGLHTASAHTHRKKEARREPEPRRA